MPLPARGRLSEAPHTPRAMTWPPRRSGPCFGSCGSWRSAACTARCIEEGAAPAGGDGETVLARFQAEVGPSMLKFRARGASNGEGKWGLETAECGDGGVGGRRERRVGAARTTIH
eukprot:scaffold13603_cov112-Isochrysis_galbana.AAC.14